MQIFAVSSSQGSCVKSPEWGFDVDCKGHNLAEEDWAVSESEKGLYIEVLNQLMDT